jgi:hypothetical protein
MQTRCILPRAESQTQPAAESAHLGGQSWRTGTPKARTFHKTGGIFHHVAGMRPACIARMCTLAWSLYRPGSEVAFRAEVARQGYAIAVTRDGASLVNEQTADANSLLRRSAELRASFQRLGYTAFPQDQDAALVSGPCWGPGIPLPASAIAHAEPVALSWDEWQTQPPTTVDSP